MNCSLDFEVSNLETLPLKKNSRSGHLSTVTAISNEISRLLTDDCNLKKVKEKLPYLDNAFERFKEAHRNYVGEILDENTISEGQCYLEGKKRKIPVFCQPIVDWRINIKHKLFAKSLQVDSAVNPEDSISCAAHQFFLVLPRFQNIQVVCNISIIVFVQFVISLLTLISFIVLFILFFYFICS